MALLMLLKASKGLLRAFWCWFDLSKEHETLWNTSTFLYIQNIHFYLKMNKVTISLQNDKYFSCFIDFPNWKEKDSIEPKVRNNPHFWSWQFSEKSEKFASFLPPKRNFSLGTNLKEFILLFFSILFFSFGVNESREAWVSYKIAFTETNFEWFKQQDSLKEIYQFWRFWTPLLGLKD